MEATRTGVEMQRMSPEAEVVTDIVAVPTLISVIWPLIASLRRRG
jgi:hypothetical protein